MPRKLRKETSKEQSDRFKRAVHEMIDAGEISPAEVEAALDALVRKAKENASD